MMNAPDQYDSRMQDAIAELRSLVSQHYPGTTFSVERGEDGEGVFLVATVDVDDTDEIVDLVIDRVLDLQIEEGIPVHVLPVSTPERQAAMFASYQARGSRTTMPLSANGQGHGNIQKSPE